MAIHNGDVPSKAATTQQSGADLSLVTLGREPGPEQSSERGGPLKVVQNGSSDVTAVGSDRPVTLPRVNSPEAEKVILTALNGGNGKPPMDIPKGTNQLVVVTSNSWTDKTAQLRVFQRDPRAGGTWHAVPDMSWAVDISEHGMGWGGGGVITKPEVTVGGEVERVGGPQPMPDGSLNKEGRVQLDHFGHAKVEGDSETVAGLFHLGVLWGTDRGHEAAPPSGTKLPFLHLDPYYRVIPKDGAPIRDEQGRLLNGQVVRNLDPAHGRYELYNPQTGDATTGSLTPEVMNAIAHNHNIEYHLVNKTEKDTSGTPLKGKLVRLTNMTYGENNLPVFDKGKTYTYTAIDPTESDPNKRVTTGTVDMSTAKDVWRDSDYFWGDDGYIGHRIIGRSADGQPITSPEQDNLYNVPLRIVNFARGEYERLDPATGKAVGRGIMDPEMMSHLADNAEDMAHELYRWAIDIRQNTGQHPDWGSAYFIHDERKDVEQGQPSSTEGCTAMSEAHIKLLMSRLQPSALLLQAPISELETVRRALAAD